MSKTLGKILILIFFFFPPLISAQESLNLTITPPLIKVNFTPGQIWQSSVKIVNNNPKDLNVFVSVMDFKSGPEGGIVFLKKKTEDDNKFLLSEWIEFPEKTILIPAFQSKNIPFSIKVPENAETGGKYAAILVGTKPPEGLEGTAIKITPLVSSLILANVRGDVKEAIWIREFSTDKTIYQKPKVNFTLKIENVGNVHIQPIGEIKIFNMYGKERGIITFNQSTEYGNILPQSLRKWNFIWEGEDSLFEIGRYKAILNLIYGNEIKQTETREVHFYILPLIPLAVVLGAISAFFVLIILITRLYVKRTILLTLSEAKKQIGHETKREEKKIPILISFRKQKIADVIKKAEIKGKKEILQKMSTFSRKTILFSLLGLLILLTVVISIYFSRVLKEKKQYKIETRAEKGQVSPEQVIEEINKEKTEFEAKTQENSQKEINKQLFSISVLNGSGIKGIANKVAEKLEKEGFKIEKIGNADHFNYQQTQIKFKKGKEKEAEFLNIFLGGKLKLIETENQKEDIILIIGKDLAL